MTDKPTFSVISPTYNCCEYIMRSYQCLLEQTQTDWEWIIVDDGSTDNSSAILSSINDERVKVYSYVRNKGRGYARNYALGKVTGKIVVVWDMDDLYIPKRLSLIKEAMSRNYDFFCSYALIIDSKFNVKGGRYFGLGNFGLPRMFVHATLAFDAKLIGHVGYGENMVAGEDLILMVHLAQQYKGFYSKEVLMLVVEDREINLHKTLDMQKNHERSIRHLLKLNVLNITFLNKLKLLASLKKKTLILKAMLLYPDIYLKTVKYRYLEAIDDKLLSEEAKSLIDKYKRNER